MLVLYILSILIELALFVPLFWKSRKFLVPLTLILTSFSLAGLIVANPSTLTAGIAVLAVFRILNLLRISKARMHPDYLYRASLRTTLWLIFYQLVWLLSVFLVANYLTKAAFWLAYSSVVTISSLVVFFVTLINIHKTRHQSVIENYADRELPTVTVAIPARNETQDLEDCIRSVIASNYPKLEVIVLDDCSGDQTPEIIRQFAHDGVRFVPGDLPQERWLAKNQAYEKLAAEASGEFIIFCGVDVRFGPETVRALITTVLNRQKDMISILPRRLTGNALMAFIQPMRYWWELALPRRFFNRPPVLSTAWLIKRKTLKKLGGFKAVCHAIIPEGYFARELIKTDKYSFVRADDLLDVQTRKNLSEQRETAIRMRYPQLRRRLELIPLLFFIELFGLLAPFIIAASGFWLGFGTAQLLAVFTCILLVAIHLSIVQISNPANILIAVTNFPVVVIVELILGLMSMWQYEFGLIEWKGRNICIPVMHTIPKLPKLD